MVCGMWLTVVEYSVKLHDEETRENVCLDQPSVKVICCWQTSILRFREEHSTCPFIHCFQHIILMYLQSETTNSKLYQYMHIFPIWVLASQRVESSTLLASTCSGRKHHWLRIQTWGQMWLPSTSTELGVNKGYNLWRNAISSTHRIEDHQQVTNAFIRNISLPRRTLVHA